MTSETWTPLPPSVQSWDSESGMLAWATSQVVGKWWIITGGISAGPAAWAYYDVLPLYVLDLEHWEWYAPPADNPGDTIFNRNNAAITISNTAALMRADGASSCVIDGSKMLVYIGWQCYDTPTLDCAVRPPQQFFIDPTTDPRHWTVTPVPIVGKSPKFSYLASTPIMNSAEGGNATLYTFGGQYMDAFNAVFVTNRVYRLELTTMTWDEIVVENAAQISPRASSIGMRYDNTFFVLGGHAWDGGSPDLWQLLPAAGADINQSKLSGDLLNSLVVAGMQTQLSFSLHNVDGSVVTYGGAYVTGTLIQENGNTGIGLAGTDLLNGTYTISILQFSSGKFSLEIYLNGDLYHSAGIPVSFRPADPHLANSTVAAGGSAAGLWEDTGAFQITLVDVYGNVVTDDAAEGLQGLAALFESDGLPLIPKSINGALYLTYGDRKAGDDVVNVTLNGQHIKGSPFRIKVITAAQISYSDPVIAVVTLLNALGVFLALLTLLWVLKERNTQALRHASPAILALLALTHAALFLGNVFGPTFSVASCYLREWILFMGANAVMALLLGKTGRLYVLFIGRPTRKMKITDGQLIKLAGIVVGAAVILLLIKSIVVSWTVQRTALGTYNEAWSCQTSPRYSGGTSLPNLMTAVLLLWTAGLGTVLLYVAYQTRDCLKQSRESRIIVAQYLIVAATVIAYGAVRGGAKDFSAVKQFYIEVWLVCLDIYVSLLTIVAAKLTSVQNLYTTVWSGASSAGRTSTISSTGGTTEDEEVTISTLPDDKRASLASPTDRKASMVPTGADALLKALKWRDEAKMRGTTAYPCSIRIASRTWRLLSWLMQWDVGLLVINSTVGMCALLPGAFSGASASKVIDLRSITAIKWNVRTVMIETPMVIVHVRLPSSEELEALKLYLQPLCSR
ncbi:hypothetical protein HDU88_003975 [Geranomyces variabilis]|nr:hypothetical protein HDU88_003975 [Geranomyces variabilis]